MSGNRAVIFGKVFTGWKATTILYLVVLLLIGGGFAAGWKHARDYYQEYGFTNV